MKQRQNSKKNTAASSTVRCCTQSSLVSADFFSLSIQSQGVQLKPCLTETPRGSNRSNLAWQLCQHNININIILTLYDIMNGMAYYFCCGARQTAENRKRTQRSNFRRYNTDYSRRQLMLLSPLYIAVCCIVVIAILLRAAWASITHEHYHAI